MSHRGCCTVAVRLFCIQNVGGSIPFTSMYIIMSHMLYDAYNIYISYVLLISYNRTSIVAQIEGFCTVIERLFRTVQYWTIYVVGRTKLKMGERTAVGGAYIYTDSLSIFVNSFVSMVNLVSSYFEICHRATKSDFKDVYLIGGTSSLKRIYTICLRDM